MKTTFGKRLARLFAAGGLTLTLGSLSTILAQQPQPTAAPSQEQTRREERRDAVQPAREQARGTIQESRDTAQGAREGVRDTARDTRQANQDSRETIREGVQGNRQEAREVRDNAQDIVSEARETVRDARRDIREARRAFRAERVRSGDLGVWLRQAANRLLISDVASTGAIAKTGLQEGDEIVSVGGQRVATEREFVDRLFANQDSNQPVSVIVRRNGQQQTVEVNPKTFADEYLVTEANSLHEYGIILDESVPDRLKVQAVVPRSPAYYAGVRSGDQITGLRGQRINRIADLVRGLASAGGNSTQISVNRNDQARQLDIDIPAQNAGEARTALRPNLDRPSTTQPVQPLTPPANRQPAAVDPQSPANTQPRLNPPR